jgi:hypothetical protein
MRFRCELRELNAGCSFVRFGSTSGCVVLEVKTSFVTLRSVDSRFITG